MEYSFLSHPPFTLNAIILWSPLGVQIPYFLPWFLGHVFHIRGNGLVQVTVGSICLIFTLWQFNIAIENGHV